MTQVDRFRQLCNEVRFQLDEPVDRPPDGHGAADYVAQIRMNGLRVTPTTTPVLHEALGRVTTALRIDQPPEVYVVNDPLANAAAPGFGPAYRPFMVLNSGLVELLTPTEIEFAIGHELGHLGMRHAGMTQAHASEMAALQARSSQRCQEISADRIGLLATRSVFTAAQVMVKLASGLRGDSVALDIPAFLSQLDRDPEEMSREWELYQSHPALPLRLWALLRFGATAEYARLAGTGDGGERLVEIDQEISARLASLGDGRLDEMESRFFLLALTWLGLMLVMQDDRIEPHERDELVNLVGEEHAAKAVRFAEDHGKPAAEKKLREALERIRSTSMLLKRRFVESFRSFAYALGVDPERTAAGNLVKELLGADIMSSDGSSDEA